MWPSLVRQLSDQWRTASQSCCRANARRQRRWRRYSDAPNLQGFGDSPRRQRRAFELTSRARKAGGDAVFKFSPLDPERRTHCYNPVLDIAALPPERQFTETRRLAANLITAKGKGAEGFIDGARDLFVAGILTCIERGTPTIGAVYDLFAQPGEKYKLLRTSRKKAEIKRLSVFSTIWRVTTRKF